MHNAGLLVLSPRQVSVEKMPMACGSRSRPGQNRRCDSHRCSWSRRRNRIPEISGVFTREEAAPATRGLAKEILKSRRRSQAHCLQEPQTQIQITDAEK